MDDTPRIPTLPAVPRDVGFHIDGRTVPAGDRALLTRLSPGHDVPVSRTPVCTAADVDRAVAAARQAFEDRRWSGLSGADRAAMLLRTAALVRERAEEIAYWETLETGKPITQARAEVGGCVGMFEYAAGLARTLHGDSFNNLGDGMVGIVTREPVGVVGLITPWNFPFLILCERIPYILAGGNTIVARPSEVTSATTLIMADILADAGVPAGVFNVVTGPGPEVGQPLAEHRDVDMLSFTGSTAVGRIIVAAAGRSNFKKLSLELGGKNPQIVFADADLEAAADGVAFGVGFNAGQCCVSGSRLIVERRVAETVSRMVADKLARAVVGDPLDPATQIGAITTTAQHNTILDHISTGRAAGATLVCGGEPLDIGRGRHIAPTLFTDVTREMSIARAEIFGPVLAIMPFDSVEQAIAMANDTDYGLAASVWTKDIDTALTVTRRVRAGRFWVNTTLAGGPELPIGGFKQSGWGREAGASGVEEYTQVKSVHVAIGDRTPWIG